MALPDQVKKAIVNMTLYNIKVPLAPSAMQGQKELLDWINAYTPTAEQKPETDEAKKRYRYRYTSKHLDGHIFDRESTTRVADLYLDLITSTQIRSKVKGYLLLMGENFTLRASQLSDIMKKYQTDVDRDWLYLVDMYSLQDYQDIIAPKDILEGVRDWVKGHITHEFVDGGFMPALATGIRDFFSKATPFTKTPITAQQFLSDPMYWATPGSSDEKPLMLKNQRGTFKARKGKWATAMAVTQDELNQIMFRNAPQKNKAVVKRELKKSRMLIVGDMPNYLRMSYISYWLEDILKGHPNTTLFYNEDQTFSMWVHMVQSTNDQHTWALPMDESKYDHMITKDMLASAFSEIRQLISTSAPQLMVSDLLQALDLTAESILHTQGSVIVPGDGGGEVTVEKGLLSGWRWTAFLDTLFNYAKFFAYRSRIVQRVNMPPALSDPAVYSVHQGDDLVSRVKSPAHAQMLYDMYEETNFDVNLGKVFLKQRTDEFLRQLARDGNCLTGYPARGITALLYRNPTSREFNVGEDRIFELAQNWLTVGRRCQTDIQKLESHMIADISAANGISKQTVRDIIHAPAYYGGLGLEPIIPKQITLKKSIATYKHTVPIAPLATHFSHPSIANEHWYTGVEPGPKAEVSHSRFEVKVTDAPLASQLLERIDITLVRDRPRSIAPRFIETLSPTEVTIAKELMRDMRHQELLQYAATVLDLTSYARLTSLSSRASIAIIKAWLLDDLPFRVPSNWCQSSTLIARAYKNYCYNAFNTLIAHSKITRNSLHKIAASAEWFASQTARTYPIRFTG
jgi:hypothetical protein